MLQGGSHKEDQCYLHFTPHWPNQILHQKFVISNNLFTNLKKKGLYHIIGHISNNLVKTHWYCFVNLNTY